MYAASPELIGGARDYRWLLDRGYPETSSLKLVGDRHRLDKDERLVLFRGVFAAAPSLKRAAAVSDPAGRPLFVDGYNEVFTVMHYLLGRPVFLASDGLLRDAGAAHGRVADAALFDRAASLLVADLARRGVAEVIAWFDSPVPFSAGHAAAFQEKLVAAGIAGRASVERSADLPLKRAEAAAAVATSDSAVVDALLSRRGARFDERRSGRDERRSDGRSVDPDGAERGPVVFDAARAAIEAAFGPLAWLDFAAALG